MKVKELLNSKISLYKRVKETKSQTITLDDWLHKVTPAAKKVVTDIRVANVSDPKAAKAMKTVNLPCCTISGVFEGERKASLVTEKNPVICIDIDKIPAGITIEELKKEVFELPYVFYVSLSARGEGIFALIYYNKKNDFLRTFKALEQDFKNLDIEIDKACKDICRLRFVSWDEHPLEKEEVDMYNEESIEAFDMPQFDQHLEYHSYTQHMYDDYFTYKTIKYLINYCGYRADEYQDWLIDGFRLATFGEYGYHLFMLLSNVSEGFNLSVAEKKWKECVRTTQMTKDCLAYYYGEAKKRLGSNWKTIIRNS
jgi:hypothetical protein